MDNIKTDETVFVSEAEKTCPTCGCRLEAAAVSCPICGARFEVHTRAYCTHCHKLIHASAEGKCPNCGSAGLLDPRLYSSLTAAGTIPVQPAAGAPAGQPAAESLPAAAAAVAAPPPSAETRKCPVCAETIKAEARLCRFCGARFDVIVNGYCTNCHAEVALDANDRCSRCGGEVIDRHVSSTLVGTAAPTPVRAAAAPVPAAPAPAPAAVTSAYIQTAASAVTSTPVQAAPVPKVHMPFWQLYFSPKGRIGRLTFFLKGMLPVWGLLGLSLGVVIGVLPSLDTSRMSAAAEALLSIGMLILSIGMLCLWWVLLMLIVKRFHDLGRSGWNILLWILPLVGQFIYLWNWLELFFFPGTPGPSKYGESAG